MKCLFLLLLGLSLSLVSVGQSFYLSPEAKSSYEKQLRKSFASEADLFPEMMQRQMQLGGFNALGPAERKFRLAQEKFKAALQQRLQTTQTVRDTNFVVLLHLYLHPDGRIAHFSPDYQQFRPTNSQIDELQRVLSEWLSTYQYPVTVSSPFRVTIFAPLRRSASPKVAGTITSVNQLLQTNRPDTVKKIVLIRQELTQLPEELARFTNTEEINLEGNELIKVPSFVWLLPRLKRLWLTGNRISDNDLVIPEGSSLTFLNLQYNRLTKVPESVVNCRRLTSLWLGHNKLTYLNTDILRKLKKLEDLNLYNTGLKQLPSGIGKLRRLQVLDLYYNELRDLPKQICQLRRLQQLAVSENKLGYLPLKIHRMRRLERIYAHHNFLASLPDKLRRSRRLELLDIGYNSFSYIPPVVCQIKPLRDLNVGHNRLTEIPADLIKLPKLEKCYLRGNPLTEKSQLTVSMPVIEKLEARKTEVYY